MENRTVCNWLVRGVTSSTSAAGAIDPRNDETPDMIPALTTPRISRNPLIAFSLDRSSIQLDYVAGLL